MDNRPIGVMDSGVGGLTVARYLREKYPNEGILFVGDTGRNPYGERTPEEITSFAGEMKEYLIRHGVKMIFIACNTISFNTPDDFTDAPVPMVRMSLHFPDLSHCRKAAVLATPATIATHRHYRVLREQYPELAICELGFPGLAHAIETGTPKEEWDKLIQPVVEKTGAADADAAILNCTHFPFATDRFKKYMPHAVFIDPAEATVEEGMDILRREDGLASEKQPDLFCFTAGTDIAEPLVRQIFNTDAPVREITLMED
jgi:glutamate racemase